MGIKINTKHQTSNKLQTQKLQKMQNTKHQTSNKLQ